MEQKKMEMRMRFQPTGLQVREAGEGENRTIEGCAIVFGQETTLWDGKYYKEREIIARESITEEFLKTQDIKLNLLHERNDTLARCNKGEGTLNLELREDGLYFNVELPKCDLGDRALELIRNKTYTGCSFEFMPKTYDTETTIDADGKEDTLYTVREFEYISALTIAMDPAYEQTSVQEKREQYANREEELQKKRESEAEEQALREAEEKHKQEMHLRALSRMQMETDLAEMGA